MPKRTMDVSEKYPVFSLYAGVGYNDDAYPEQEFSEDELADYERVLREYDAWQNKIKSRFGVKD